MKKLDVRMEHTEGVARQADVWVDGRLLTVCDSISSPACRCAPGPLEGVKFFYPSLEGFSWTRAVGGNRDGKYRLEHIRHWSYVGYGRVVGIMPVLINFGLLTMEDPNWSDQESLIGKYVKVPIDCLEITRAQ
ncbi:MAG: hypothetical protein QF792_08330 [Phycisphaerae bacterium]|jgi:hypothetical protein|nr:hypothetical protein [Phycisphaerae bacterium]